MITEDYVSFETAKLLKKKGFDCPSYSHYRLDNGELCRFNTNCSTNLEQNNYVTAPTLQMAMKWLREVHNIHVVPKYDFYGGDYTGRIYDGRRETAYERDDYIAIVGNSTYEQACEAAIKYCLEKLI